MCGKQHSTYDICDTHFIEQQQEKRAGKQQKHRRDAQTKSPHTRTHTHTHTHTEREREREREMYIDRYELCISKYSPQTAIEREEEIEW